MLGKPLVAAIAAAAVGLLIAGYLLARHDGTAVAGTANSGPGPVAAQFIYTARTANDASVTLPASVHGQLLRIALIHQSIALTRIGYTGQESTSDIDMTPRTGNSSSDPPLRVTSRAIQVADAKISAIQQTINSPRATAHGSQALYAGLARTSFSSIPVTIISTGLDLANPDNFRALKWSVSPGQLAASLKPAHELTLHGPVTFVVVPTAGPQPQLGQAQKAYVQAVWTHLLTAAGATSVRFIDANGGPSRSRDPSAPIVPVPGFPSTVIPPVPGPGHEVTCTLSASYFIFDTAKLISPAGTRQDLTRCIRQALADHASLALDGWTSYEGPLTATGRPEFNYRYNLRLSRARVRTIARLLMHGLGVPRSAITRLTGHGNADQPDPDDPRSAANRVVIITYTV